jgi:signal transduction histidine kinase
VRSGRPPSALVESASGRTRELRRLAWLALLVAAYFAAGKLGLSFALVHPSATPVWAPTGIALASVLTLGYSASAAIFLGAFLVNVTTHGSIATSLGIATGNTLEAVVGAFLVNRFANGPHAFERAADTFKFTALAAMLSTTLSATLGVTSLALGGAAPWDKFGPIWVTWWLGDLGGCLVIAPLLILWGRGGWPKWDRAQWLEAFAVLLYMIAVGQVVFGPLLPEGLRGFPLAFVCMPGLIWAAFRFDPRMAAAAMLVLSMTAVWGTLGAGATAGKVGLNTSLLLLQVFLGVMAVTALSLAALVAEQKRGEGAVRAASAKLREALSELEAFSHSISHDLRSPIGAVLNYAAIIEQDGSDRLDGESLRLLGRIRASGEAAVQLLDQLVRFVWVEREAEARQSVDMTSLAREAFAELAEGSENPGDVRFAVAELPAAHGSPAMLLRVFRNLLSNAVKYTRGRTDRCIDVAGVAGALENTYIVSDNGIGFEPGLGATLYQPFKRLGAARDSEGSGLGLAIVAKIVRRHGGRVWAESDGVTGARFCFTLPHTGNRA